MSASPPVGLGTLLRHLLSKLDGDVQSLYDELEIAFRPRFYPVVQQLLRERSATVGALSSNAGVSQPAMTQTIGEMKRLGLVTSARAADPRQRLVRLTGEGKRVVARLQPIWTATAKAAAELDEELPAPLPEVVAAALDALDRAAFKDRIRRKLRDG